MEGTLNVDTTDLERVERPAPKVGPPLDTPILRSPFYIAQVPTTAVVNPDNIRNFHTPGIPSYRIVSPQPLTLAGSGVNANTEVATPAIITPQPPAPIISQTLTTIPTGYTFTFLQVKLPMNTNAAAVISSYKIYRNTANATGGATVIQTISHGLTNTGSPIVVTDPQPNGVVFFYFVSAVNVSGVESTLTPAQSGSVTSNAGFNSHSQLASSFHGLPSNVTWAPINTTVLSNSGLITTVAVAANTNQFPPGTRSYNSGTIDPGIFTTSVIYVDDSTFSGGALPYNFTTAALGVNIQAASDSRLLLGKIATANSTATSGGGSTGGSTPQGQGGRNLIQF